MKYLGKVIFCTLIIVFLLINCCFASSELMDNGYNERVQENINIKNNKQEENPITDFMIICMGIYFVGLPIILFCLKRNSKENNCSYNNIHYLFRNCI